MTKYLWTPPAVKSLPVEGSTEEFPINRLFFVGRNYHAHANEMQSPVDKSVEVPFYFTKDPSALTLTDSTVPYPAGTKNYHYEMELVLAIGKDGFRVSEADADKIIYGYACGLDMTRRDLQLKAREKSRPWDLGKDIENGAIASAIKPMQGVVLEKGAIQLSVNNEVKQESDISMLIWSIRELIADLSQYYHLKAGDLIYTGTPAGVGPVQTGDKLTGAIEGVGSIALTIGSAE